MATAFAYGDGPRASAREVDLVDELVEQVRERLADARSRVPSGTPDVTAVVADVVAGHARSWTGPVHVADELDRLTAQVVDIVTGFGPLQRLLDDPEVEELWINEPGRVFVARRGRSELTTVVLRPGQVANLVERMLRTSGRRVDLSAPFVDAVLPDGSRLHVVIPDVTRRHWAVNIRKFVVPANHLGDLIDLGTLTAHSARFLDAAVVAGLNILVSGGTQAGKTTLLNCLLNAVPPTERVVTCEEVFELQLALPDWVAMQTRQVSLEGSGEIPLRRLIKEALRMRPDRVVVGEVRQEESLDLLIALNSGLPGMCSIHANGAREAITKLCTLPLLAGPNVSWHFVTPTVATAIDVVVHTENGPDGRRQVREIVSIPGRVEMSGSGAGSIEIADVFRTTDGQLRRADGFPPHAERFASKGIDLPALLDGRDN